MAGTSYTRQSSLVDGDTITASLFNDEYNQLVNAFAYSPVGTTGHQHDGSAGEGGNIEIIGDQDFKNKIVVDSTNNRWSIFVEVGGTAVEQVRIEDGVVYPVTDSDVDLGTDAARFKAAYIDSITATTSLTLGASITVSSILDEDDMASNSATALATQQSIKAYVDSQVTAQDLDLTDGTTSISIDLDSEVLSVLGGTGIDSTASGNGVTLAIDSTVATLDDTQTLSNKTLTAPVISGNLTTDGTIDGRDVAADGTKLDGIEALADVTDTANVTAAGALMDSELTSIASVKALDQGVATTDSPTFAAATVTGEIIANGGIALGDSDKATFGAGDDLQIFHNGSHSYIRDTGTGNLRVTAQNFNLRNAADNANILTGTDGGSVLAYYDGNLKLTTTATGIDVTGTATMDGLTVDGTANFNANNIIHTALTPTYVLSESDVTDNNTQFLQASGTLRIRTVNDAGSNIAERMRIDHGTGDISFYEDTGTTTKLVWSASDEDLNFADNVKATFGAGDDLQIYHDGSNSYIRDTGTGNLNISADQLQILNAGNSEIKAGFTTDGAVDLYHNNALKLATTSTGIDVTGTVTANSLKAPAATFEAAAVNIDLLETNTTDVNTRFRLNGGEFIVQTLNDAQDAVNSRLVIDNATGDISFYEDTGTTAKFFWDASAESLGIGTTSPLNTLHVAGTMRYDGRLLTNSTTSDGTEEAPSIVVGYDYDTGFFRPGADTIGFATNGAERMRLASTGRLGIGTIVPVAGLHVAGNVTSGETTGYFVGTEGRNNYVRIGADANRRKSLVFESGGVDRFSMGVGDSDELAETSFFIGAGVSGGTGADLTITSGGAVGIGTLTPSKELVVNQDSAECVALIKSSDTGVAGIYLGGQTDEIKGGLLFDNSDNSLQLRGYNNAEAVRIDTSGHAIIPAGVTLGTATGVYNAANTLDDYEEGTWTPALGGGATATNMSGKYTKVGRLVTVFFTLENSTISGTPDYIVSGLPFTNGSERAPLSVTYLSTFNAPCETLAGFITGNGSNMEFLGLIQGGTWIAANLTAGSGRYAYAVASYQTA